MLFPQPGLVQFKCLPYLKFPYPLPIIFLGCYFFFLDHLFPFWLIFQVIVYFFVSLASYGIKYILTCDPKQCTLPFWVYFFPNKGIVHLLGLICYINQLMYLRLWAQWCLNRHFISFFPSSLPSFQLFPLCLILHGHLFLPFPLFSSLSLLPYFLSSFLFFLSPM